jgi:hypothetical protein
MNPQITINIGSGATGSYSGSSTAFDQSGLPSPVLGAGAALSQDAAATGQTDLPSPVMQGGSGDTQSNTGLPTPLMQAGSGDVQSGAAGLPTPLMQGGAGDTQSTAGLPTPLMQSGAGDTQSNTGLPTPLMQAGSGAAAAASTGLPQPTARGHLGEHETAAASESPGGDPMPIELQELMVLIKADEEKRGAAPQPGEQAAAALKRGKK